jgi:nicotinate-nucleotide adenylyltransferase
MLRAAIENHPAFSVDEREFRREGPSYTLDTLKSFRADTDGADIVLLVGMDAFLGLTTWHRWRELIEYCHMVVMTRPGADIPEQGELADFIGLHRVTDADALASQATGLLLFHTVSQLDISGTQIRKQLAAGQDAGFLLPESVLEIIRAEGLYTIGKTNG